jgi:hypothetical protein
MQKIAHDLSKKTAKTRNDISPGKLKMLIKSRDRLIKYHRFFDKLAQEIKANLTEKDTGTSTNAQR